MVHALEDRSFRTNLVALVLLTLVWMFAVAGPLGSSAATTHVLQTHELSQVEGQGWGTALIVTGLLIAVVGTAAVLTGGAVIIVGAALADTAICSTGATAFLFGSAYAAGGSLVAGGGAYLDSRGY